jgi:hypothetical protein
MDKEILEVIDTAIKIGLAGLFTSFTALKISTFNIKKEIHIAELNKQKEIQILALKNDLEIKTTIYENRMKTVNEVTELIVEYFHAFNELSSYFAERIDNDNLAETLEIDKQPQIDNETINKKLDVFTTTNNNKNKALSKIKILQLSGAETAIVRCEKTVLHYIFCLRGAAHKKIPEETGRIVLMNIVNEFTGYKDNFYKEINEYISRISKV